MSEQSNKDLLKTIGKSFTQIATNFWVNRKNTLLNRLKQAALYAFHMFIFAWFFVGILYPIAASNPDTILLADKGVKAAINITSSFWGALVDIGTIMAGAGTVGLLWFGWTKADEWTKQRHTILKDETLKFYLALQSSLFMIEVRNKHLFTVLNDLKEEKNRTKNYIKTHMKY